MWDSVEVFSFFVGLLDLHIQGARSKGPLFGTLSVDTAILDVALFRNQIASLEQ